MEKVIIAALSENHVLGKQGELPWSLPRDEQHLKNLIQDGWLLTGRTSFQSSQGDDLFSQRSDVIVLTRQQDFSVPDKYIAHSLKSAYAKAAKAGADCLYILGGSRVYQQAIQDADRMVLTHVHAKVEGDAYFPEIAPNTWREIRREDYPSDEAHTHPFSFVWYKRIQ